MKNNLEWKIIIPLSLFLIIANFLGWLNGLAALKWFKDNSVSIVIAILLALLYFIIRIYEKKEEIEKKIVDSIAHQSEMIKLIILSSLKAPFIREFMTEEEFKEYYISRVGQARVKVDDLTWSHRIGERQQLKHLVEKEAQLGKKIDYVSGSIIYREIFMFNVPSRKNKLVLRLIENKGGYNCSCFFEEIAIPRLQYVLIDGEEAIFTSNAFGVKFTITNPVILRILQTNFDTAWNASTPLKHGYYWYMENLERALGQSITQIRKEAKENDKITEL